MPIVLLSLYYLLSQASAQNFRFEAQTIDSAVSIGYGLAIGDVDGDKKPDIVLADKKQFVWYRNGDWKKFILIENLTQHDNVCVAAKDLDSDGKVEIAVGAQWNPSETKDHTQSGAVFFLERPSDPTRLWKAIALYHEPTIHRMRWVESGGVHYLAVLPLHGIENKNGAGKAVNLLLYKYPQLLTQKDSVLTVGTGLHLTHNLEVVSSSALATPGIYIAGKESIGVLRQEAIESAIVDLNQLPGFTGGGELRLGRLDAKKSFMATIEPMHGNNLVLYTGNANERSVLDSNLKEGHALATGDFLGLQYDQIVVGWRGKNNEGKVGVKLYFKDTSGSGNWQWQWIDEEMACEDLQVMDLNGDGRLDIIASGRSTHNLKIYWNKG